MLKNKVLGSALALIASSTAYGCTNEFSVGLLASNYDHTFTVSDSQNKDKDKASSFAFGGSFNYLYTSPQQFIFGLDANITGYAKNSRFVTFEGRLKTGKGFSVGNGAFLTPYTGFGIHTMSVLKKGGWSAHSYYIPLGLKSKNSINSCWALETFVEYDVVVGKSYKTSLKKEYGLKAGFECVKTLANKNAIAFGPFVNYWNAHEKDKDTAVKFKEKTIETGISFKYRF